MKDTPAHTQDEIEARRELVALARAMLSGELPYLEGADRVYTLRGRLSSSLDADEDLQAFMVISSETDHLPLQAQRHLWSPRALASLEPDIARVQVWAETFAPQACKSLIARFGDG